MSCERCEKEGYYKDWVCDECWDHLMTLLPPQIEEIKEETDYTKRKFDDDLRIVHTVVRDYKYTDRILSEHYE